MDGWQVIHRVRDDEWQVSLQKSREQMRRLWSDMERRQQEPKPDVTPYDIEQMGQELWDEIGQDEREKKWLLYPKPLWPGSWVRNPRGAIMTVGHCFRSWKVEHYGAWIVEVYPLKRIVS